MVRYYLTTLAVHAPSGYVCPPPVFVAVVPGPSGQRYRAVDLRPDPALLAGEWLVECDPTPAEHAAILATAGVTYLPFEDATGTTVTALTLGDVSPANRATLNTIADARHIPAGDFTLADSCRRVVRRFIRRALLRQVLGANDWTEVLTSLVSAMSAPKRNAINATLTALGFDTSVVNGSDTIRQAMRKLVSQRVALLALDGWDD